VSVFQFRTVPETPQAAGRKMLGVGGAAWKTVHEAESGVFEQVWEKLSG
jgi:hypothetical protein